MQLFLIIQTCGSLSNVAENFSFVKQIKYFHLKNF